MGLTHEHRAKTYFILYYQFIQHAFGISGLQTSPEKKRWLRIYFDQFPDTKSRTREFREYIYKLQQSHH